MQKVFVFGDSHAVALAEGAEALGLTTGMAFLSGNLWHLGVVRFNRNRGLVARGGAGFNERLITASETLGTPNVLEGDHLVIGSFGYQLGRLVSPLLRDGHKIAGEDVPTEQGQFVSTGFLEALVDAHRATQFRLMRQIARRRPLVVVSPPPIGDRPEYARVRDIIGDRIQSTGAHSLDSRSLLLPGAGTLPESERHEDGRHATGAFGERAIKAAIEMASAEKVA